MPYTTIRRQLVLATAVLLLGACSMFGAGKNKGQQDLALTGFRQVPPNKSTASGTSSITVNNEHKVSGSITVRGIKPSMVQIHTGAAGINGAPIITLEKSAETVYVVPAGASLSQAQYLAYSAGNLYVNVSSTAFPEGEIRAQLSPAK